MRECGTLLGMEPENADERQLWARCVDGDGEAFGLVFELHRGRVIATARRLLQQHEDAEDATGVAFLELWRKRAAVRVVNGSVLPWLLVTVGNVARNHHRSRHRYRKLLDALPHGTPVASAEDAALEQFADPRVTAMLRSLSAADLQLVTLVMIEGYPPAEVATLLKTTPGALRTRLHRLRISLQNTLQLPADDGQLVSERGTR